MNDKTNTLQPKEIALRAGRALLKQSVVFLASLLARSAILIVISLSAILSRNSLRESLYTPDNLKLATTLIYPFIYNIGSYSFFEFDKKAHYAFSLRNKAPKIKEALLSIDFLLNVAALALFMIVNMGIIHSLPLFPFLLIIDIGAYLHTLKNWSKNSSVEMDKKTVFRHILFFIVHTLLWTAIPIMAPIAISVVVGLAAAAGAILINIIKYVIFVIVLILFISYTTALRKRIRFIKKLKKLCDQKKASISEMHRPYLSVFIPQSKETFTLKANGKTYSCKLMSFANKFLPVIFTPDGYYHRISAWALKKGITPTIQKDTQYGFESPNQKLLILTSIPYIVLAREYGMNTNIDVGESCGEYKIFNTDGLLGAIDRDTIDRKVYSYK